MTEQRAVLFDFGGVLIRMDADAYDEVGARWNLPPGALTEAFYRIPEWHAIETGQGDWAKWQQGVERFLEPWLSDPVGDVQAILDAWYAQPWSYHLPNFELARDLRAAGHKVGVLSNAPDDLRERFLSELPMEIEWDAIVVSGEIGMRKPDPRIFEYAAEAIGTAPERCFFIDDLHENAAAARAVGMRAFHFTRNNYGALRVALRTAGIEC